MEEDRKAAAEEVRAAVTALNAAAMRATELGMFVNYTTVERQRIGKHPVPVLAASICQPI